MFCIVSMRSNLSSSVIISDENDVIPTNLTAVFVGVPIAVLILSVAIFTVLYVRKRRNGKSSNCKSEVI